MTLPLPQRIGQVEIRRDRVVHEMLGEFRRSGVFRSPLPGEYFLTEPGIGIGYEVKLGEPELGPREILEKV
jgi:hypothetical protein